MTKVIGEFIIVVREPIVAAPDIINSLNKNNQSLSKLTLSVQDAEVVVSLGEQTDPTFDEHGEQELPEIKGFRVRITRDVVLQTDAAGQEVLTRNDEQEFERILIEAVRRTVSAIKKRIKQPSIDTRRPIYGYRCSYYRDDGTLLRDEFPSEPKSYRCPSYALYSLAGIHTPFMPSKELDTAMWTDLQGEVNSSVELPLYEELIYDAVTLQAAMKYEHATLSAAGAVEIMLPRICCALLRRTGNLKYEQATTIVLGQGSRKLGQVFRTLKPNAGTLHEGIKSLVDDRNAIAHGDSHKIDPERMADSINTAYGVKSILDDLQGSGVTAL